MPVTRISCSVLISMNSGASAWIAACLCVCGCGVCVCVCVCVWVVCVCVQKNTVSETMDLYIKQLLIN